MQHVEQEDLDVPTGKIEFANSLFESAINTIMHNSQDIQEGISVVLTSLQHATACFLVSIGDSFPKGLEEEAFAEGLDLIDRNIRGMVADLRREKAEDAAVDTSPRAQ